MQITVSGKGVDVGQAFIQYAESKIEEVIGKYTDRVTNVDVIASKVSHLFNISMHGNMGTHEHMLIKSSGSAGDIHSALDEALAKIEKQLRRYKRKITNHHKVMSDKPVGKAKKYVLTSEAGEQENEPDAANGVVIAEKPTAIETLTVSEAVMRMDLQDLPALMFYNAGNGRMNVVYRRADGNISWVDPEEQVAA